MKKSLLLLCSSLILLFQFTQAQQESHIASKVRAAHTKGADFKEQVLFKRIGDPDLGMQNILPKGNMLGLDKQVLKSLIQNKPGSLTLLLPAENGRVIPVELIKNEIFSPGFKVNSSSNGNAQDYIPGLYYQGVIKGTKKSIAAISIFNDDVVGVFQIEGDGKYVLGKMDKDVSDRYVLFRSEDLKHDMVRECNPMESPEAKAMLAPSTQMIAAASASNCVRIYFEVDYQMYVDNGSSVANTVNKMTGIYNVVKTLYDNESINTSISEIFVWETEDPYGVYTATSDALYAFRNNKNATGFNGDLAHLVSRGAPSGGGVAWISGLCNSYSYAYSYIYNSYSQFPTYSWTVEVITHEMGHNLGSRHTHACAWDVNGDGVAGEMIDGCGPSAGYSEGSCTVAPLPSGGGTIMSYCHLTSAGINFNNGFGPLPGAAIRNYTYNASCLTVCSTCTVSLSFNKTDLQCNGSLTGTAVVNPTGGTAPYRYAWSNGATTQSITGLAAGTYDVTVTDDDGAGCAVFGSVTINQPAAITINGTIVDEAVSGANNGSIDITVTGGTSPYSYAWSNGKSTQDITALSGGDYTVTVTDNKNCTSQKAFTVNSNSCGTQVSSFPMNESFENTTMNWKQVTYDNFDWTRRSGPVPTAKTGPSSAYNGSFYMYLEATGNTGTAVMESPCLDLTGKINTSLDFWYSMYGAAMGTLAVDVSVDNGATWTQLWSLSGNQGTSWLFKSIDLSNYKTLFTKLRFRGIRGSGQTSDMAVDNVTVKATIPPCMNLSASSTQASANADDGTINLTVSGAVAPLIYSWTGPNGFTASTEDLSALAAGLYLVTVQASGECVASTAVTVSKETTLTCTNTTLTENFESGWGSIVQSSSDNFNWRRNKGNTKTANTGPSTGYNSTWYVYADGHDGSVGAKAIIESGCINLLNASSPNLSFAYHMSGANMGSLQVEVSKDNGVTWSPLWSINGDQGNVWKLVNQSLVSCIGQIIKIRFIATLGGSLSDIGLDAISVTPVSALSGSKSMLQTEKLSINTNHFNWRTLYPNPSNGNFKLGIYSSENVWIDVSVFDINGRKYVSRKQQMLAGENQVNFTIPGLPRGMYMVRVIKGNEVHSKMLKVE